MKLALLAGVLMVLGLAGVLVCTILRVHQHYNAELETDYGIVFDAGSTSTKAYVYEWEHKTTAFLPMVSLSMSDDKVPRTYRVRPGIGTLNPNATTVSSYLDPLMDWACALIPNEKKSSTPIYFMGTGDMRQLDDTTQGALLTSVRVKLQQSGFKFDGSQASVLSGSEEAAYGFLSVNELYGYFSTEDSKPQIHGSLDMGGVSSEIAFISADHPPANYTFTTEINGTLYTLWAQSADGLGVNEARYYLNMTLYLNSTGSTVSDPCAPVGYFENATIQIAGKWVSFMLIGSSDYAACVAQVNTLVARLTKSLPAPPIRGTTFVVADHYLDVKKFYKLKDNANLLELQAKVSSFCMLDYNHALSHHSDFAKDVQNFCFMGNYIVSLLRDYYGFDPTLRRILWKDSIKKAPVSWTLGAMMNEVNQLPPDTSSLRRVRFIRFFRTAGGTVTLFISCLLVVLGLVLLILQRRRPTEYVEVR